MTTPTEHPVPGRLRYDPPTFGPITEKAVRAFSKARPWMFLCGVLLLVSACFMGLAAIALVFVDNQTAGPAARILGLLPLFYLIIALIYFILSSHLMQSASSLKKMESGANELALESFAKLQATFWRLVGITSLAMIGVMGLVIVAVALAGLISR